ncbi:calcyclin-binding protein CacyBP, putative [Ixodes scapularis]|uniref:Calcyclin-binding protein CacyBP, putative n=1 Tax=Ixodes scapularis TaxID=6945 RepID=B7QB91_IXOSC|nr:calcyclin-binding protein CacyBP, putative [Ixodes scapularis]|eukprot:XP_002412817.1 calcyclin-binding protein CacyBP, putative [Ixodes scapularis]
MVVVFLRKSSPQDWSHVTEAEKKAKEPKKIELLVSALASKNHSLVITNLMKDILPDSSYHKVSLASPFGKPLSPDMTALVVPKPEVDSSDPSSSLMTMMKQMYDEGDDDMKRTIAKAWTEARDKQATGDFGGML